MKYCLPLKSCIIFGRAWSSRADSNLPATESNYKRTWKELTDFYENTRLLVRSYLSKFLTMQKVKHNSASNLKRIFHGIVTIYDSLDNLEHPISESEDLFVHLIVELLGLRTRDLWNEHSSDSSDSPSFERLKAFSQRRLQTLEGRHWAKEAKAEAASSKSSPHKAAKSHVTQKKEIAKKGAKSCSLCLKDHFLMFCDAFKSKSAIEKREHVSDSKLCMNCLGKHKVSECQSKKSCTVCNERHHTLLHDACREKKARKSKQWHRTSLKIALRNRLRYCSRRRKSAWRIGTIHCVRALIDQGSKTSFVSEALAQKLRLPRKHASVTVIGIGGT